MSTDAHASGPDDRRPTEPGDGPDDAANAETTAEPAGEQPAPAEPTTTLASDSAVGGPEPTSSPQASEKPGSGEVPPTAPDQAEPTSAVGPSDPGDPSDPSEPSEPERTTGRGPSSDETHVAAVPAQGGADPFDEVDGGATPTGERTAAFVPTPDEDVALREERARRFGRPTEEPDSPVESTSGAGVPLAAAGAGAVASVGDGAATRTMPATAASGSATEEDPFKDFDEGPASRAAAHWWGVLISVVFVPVSWYLIADGGERTSFSLTNGGPLNPSGLLELAAGALCLFFVLLAARWSSVGAIITGTISALIGIAYFVFNDESMAIVAEYQGTVVQALDQLGQNIVDHMLRDLQAGRIAVYGLVLIMAGVISHGARRQGRREERRKAALGL